MVNERTKIDVYFRDKERCVICGNGSRLEPVPHHCFFRSEYFDRDRDGGWNLVTICIDCHRKIHRGDRNLNCFCKRLALSRYSGDKKEKLLEIARRRKCFES